MTDLDLKLAPGCFGGPMLYREGAKECVSCPFVERCGPVAMQRLVTLREKLGVKPPTAQQMQATRKPTAHPTTGVELALPKKVEELMSRIERAGIKITEALSQGRNPFPEGTFAFMAWTCQALLKLPAGIKRETLESLFMKKLGWSQGTANAHAGQAVHLLQAVGAITYDNNILKLKGR